jgi:hypothetical protein
MINVRDNCNIPDMLHKRITVPHKIGVGADLRKFPGGNEAGKMDAIFETSRGLSGLMDAGQREARRIKSVTKRNKP